MLLSSSFLLPAVDLLLRKLFIVSAARLAASSVGRTASGLPCTSHCRYIIVPPVTTGRMTIGDDNADSGVVGALDDDVVAMDALSLSIVVVTEDAPRFCCKSLSIYSLLLIKASLSYVAISSLFSWLYSGRLSSSSIFAIAGLWLLLAIVGSDRNTYMTSLIQSAAPYAEVEGGIGDNDIVVFATIVASKVVVVIEDVVAVVDAVVVVLGGSTIPTR